MQQKSFSERLLGGLPLIGGIFTAHRRIGAIIFTGTGGIVDDFLDKVEGKGYAANPSTCEAWGMDEENQIKDENGRPVQFLSAWSPNPITLFGSDKTNITAQNIFALAEGITDDEIAWEEERRHHGTLMLWVGIVCVILTIGIVVPTIMAATSGHIKLPFLGG